MNLYQPCHRDIFAKRYAKETCKEYARRINYWIAFCQKQHLDPQAINADNLKTFLQHLKLTGGQKGTINGYFHALKAYHKLTSKDSTSRAFHHFKYQPTARKLTELPELKDVHYKRLLLWFDHASNYYTEGCREAFYLMLHCGLDVSEVCRLKRRDLIIEGAEFRLKIRGPYAREISITHRLTLGILKDYCQEIDRKGVHPFNFTQLELLRRMQFLAKKSKIPVNPYTMRAYYIRKLYRNGYSVERIAKLLGINNRQGIQRYL